MSSRTQICPAKPAAAAVADRASWRPAPTIANLYVAIYELEFIIPLLEKYLMFYKRFIDDGFAVWLHDLDPTIDAENWNNFKALINAMGLNWTFKSPRKKLIFMDMTIQIEGGKIITTIYAKPLALYQYIPPNSCHPPDHRFPV